MQTHCTIKDSECATEESRSYWEHEHQISDKNRSKVSQLDAPSTSTQNLGSELQTMDVRTVTFKTSSTESVTAKIKVPRERKYIGNRLFNARVVLERLEEEENELRNNELRNNDKVITIEDDDENEWSTYSESDSSTDFVSDSDTETYGYTDEEIETLLGAGVPHILEPIEGDDGEIIAREAVPVNLPFTQRERDSIPSENEASSSYRRTASPPRYRHVKTIYSRNANDGGSFDRNMNSVRSNNRAEEEELPSLSDYEESETCTSSNGQPIRQYVEDNVYHPLPKKRYETFLEQCKGQKCAVCLNKKYRPDMLTQCGHGVCFHCLFKLKVPNPLKPEKDIYPCPLCRANIIAFYWPKKETKKVQEGKGKTIEA